LGGLSTEKDSAENDTTTKAEKAERAEKEVAKTKD